MRRILPDVLLFVGIGCVCWGVWLWSPPMGAIVAGVAAIALAIVGAKENA